MAKSILIMIILLISLYFGSGGYIILQNDLQYENGLLLEEDEVNYKDIPFHNKEVMKAAIQQDLILKVYPYAKKIPSTLCFLITAISFSVIGSIGKIINDSIQKNIKLKDIDNLILIPLQGGIIGIIILGISYTIPIVLTNDNVSLKPISIVFLSLFGGIFYSNFYKWIGDVFNKVVFKDIKEKI